MITDATYYTGAWDHTSNRYNPRSVISALDVYNLEHSNSYGYWENIATNAYFNDGGVRTFTWTGKVALLNISDYFLSTSGSDIANREKCITNMLYDSYNDSNWFANECYKGCWLNNPSYQSEDDIVIKCNGKLADLQKIKVGDEAIDSKNYELASGSTILTLKKEYLKTLTAGVYNITFVYPDGDATTALTIKDKTVNNPTTSNDPTTNNKAVLGANHTIPNTLDNIKNMFIY